MQGNKKTAISLKNGNNLRIFVMQKFTFLLIKLQTYFRLHISFFGNKSCHSNVSIKSGI